jgi:hypothetical protein
VNFTAESDIPKDILGGGKLLFFQIKNLKA